MNRLPAWSCRLGYLARRSPAGDWRHGLQLAVAVAVAYACSAVLRLPEGLWAAMSALIVLRPTASATADAGWDRVRGTLAGTGLALAAVAFLHVDRSTPLLLLGVVLVIAFCAGLYPSMRSAPVSALIVLSIGADPQYSAFQLALMRSAEIVLGVAAGLAVSWAMPTMGARRRFQARCAAVLREIADQVQRDLCLSPVPAKEPSASMMTERGARLRSELRALAVLAVNADHEGKLADLGRWRRRASVDRDACQRTAQLLARTAHDAALFGRMADPAAASQENEAAARQALCDEITGALRTVATVMEGKFAANVPEVGMRVRNLVRAAQESALPWALAPAKLLVRDLAGLLRR